MSTQSHQAAGKASRAYTQSIMAAIADAEARGTDAPSPDDAQLGTTYRRRDPHDSHRCIFPPAPSVEAALWGGSTQMCLRGTGVRIPDGYGAEPFHVTGDGHQACEPGALR